MAQSTKLDAAKNMFRKSEQSTDANEKLLFFKKALNELDELDESQDEAVRLRRSNTRSLLNKLPSLHGVPQGLWVDYIMLMFSELNDEVNTLRKESPTLESNFTEFVRLFRDDLINFFGVKNSN